jgi:hypothetical protein
MDDKDSGDFDGRGGGGRQERRGLACAQAIRTGYSHGLFARAIRTGHSHGLFAQAIRTGHSHRPSCVQRDGSPLD